MRDYSICHSIGAIDGYNGMPKNPYIDEPEYDAYESGWEFGNGRRLEDLDLELIVRDIRSHITDWRPERSGDVWVIFSENYSAEYINAEGNYQCFDTEAEALAYIKEDEDV
jgi:hypothetical protein